MKKLKKGLLFFFYVNEEKSNFLSNFYYNDNYYCFFFILHSQTNKINIFLKSKKILFHPSEVDSILRFTFLFDFFSK